LFRDGTTHTAPIEEWFWYDYGHDWHITKYRYWIPDTETQTEIKTEPKTEKEKYMNTWTDKDEEELNKLMVKKMIIDSNNKEKLEKVASSIHCYNITEEELAYEMMDHADELIDALQPYRKQK
jgi:hypothetical protein